MILMYHKIDLVTPTSWWVSVDAFDQQMSDLAGYTVVWLDDYDSADPSHVVITFDGVYENVYRYAFPILKRWNYPFELFVVGRHIGGDNAFDTIEPLTNFCTMEQLSEMARHRGRVQWHTETHQKLIDITTEEIRREIMPNASIASAFATPHLEWFAYPHGEHDPTAVDEVRSRFKGALSCVAGDDTDRYQLNRLTVYDDSRFSKSRVSVIIANYNYARYLPEAVESVLRQTHSPDEIIIIDDHSTDNSVDVIRRYENVARVEINQTNLGIVGNFNKAVALATGDYIAFLGADNRMRSDYVERCKAALDCYPKAGVAYTDMSIFGPLSGQLASKVGAAQIAESRIDGSSVYLWRFPDPTAEALSKFDTENFVHGSSMYRRAAYEQVGGYQSSAFPEDHNLFFRMYEAGWQLTHVPHALIEYRQHSHAQANTVIGLQNELLHYRHELALQTARFRKEQDRALAELAEKDRQIAQAQKTIANIAERYATMARSEVAELNRTSIFKIGKAGPKTCLPSFVDLRAYESVRNSVFFDPEFYVEANSDVKAAGIDPALHYLLHGGLEHRDPGPFFSTSEYVIQNPDISAAGLNALVHYELHGRSEGRALRKRDLTDCAGVARTTPDNSGIYQSHRLNTIHNLVLGVDQSIAPDTRVAIGIVTYNNDSNWLVRGTKAALLSLKSAGLPIEGSLWLLDNGESSEAIVPSGPNITRLPSAGNVGFGAGHNHLMRAAFERGATIYIAVNPDGILHDRAVGALVRMLQRHNGMALVEALQFPMEHPKPYDTVTLDTSWVSGACLALSQKAFEMLGGFDEAFFMYCEDVDLSWRARAIGFALKTCPTALFLHAVTNRDETEGTQRMMFESGITLARKWGGSAFEAWLKSEMMARGISVPLVNPPQVPESWRCQADFSHSFSFAPARW